MQLASKNITLIINMPTPQKCAGLIMMRGCVSSPTCNFARLLGVPAVAGIKSLSVLITASKSDVGVQQPPTKEQVRLRGMEYGTDSQTGEMILLCSDGSSSLKCGDLITVDGSTGTIYMGAIPTQATGQDADYLTLLHWANKYKRMNILSISSDEQGVKLALECGADGIGLCNSTAMFRTRDRIDYIISLMLASTVEERNQILSALLPLHHEDYLKMYRRLHGKRIGVTLFDPRAIDFLPGCSVTCTDSFDQGIRDVAALMPINIDEAVAKAHCLMSETSRHDNPLMKGDLRMWALHPEVTEMQVKAILGKLILLINSCLCIL